MLKQLKQPWPWLCTAQSECDDVKSWGIIGVRKTCAILNVELEDEES